MQEVWIGTSGWVYKHWAESFYPRDWPRTQHLEFYFQQFPTVEINATFYRLPTESMVKGWCRKAPDGFLYAAKGSRYITHMKKLREVKEGLKNYFDRIKHLRDKLGPILWQLPPNLKKDLPRLEEFLAQLPKEPYQHAVEFRHESWVDEETFALLRKYRAAHVWLSSQKMPINFTATASFVYARFHGLENGAAHDYTREELEPWAEQLTQFSKQRKPAFVYFNNDCNTRAPLNAKMLMEMVGSLAVAPFPPEPESDRITTVRSHRTPVTPDFSQPRSKRLGSE
ncbi:MAG: DUF72 domain-containing protein [Verrucomicrobia bacterium]|nr:DUF72 domain-containing protein [Verrucomicrobiota bacterium]